MPKKLTNKHGLPQPLYSAVANDSYSKGDSDVSITRLLQPPRITALQERHDAEIEEDAMDRIWSLLGQSIHTILERADDGSELSEERLAYNISGILISGQFDRFVVGSSTIQDYKLTSAWKIKDGKVPKDHQQQVNCYAWLLRRHGWQVLNAEVIYILRDWSKREAQRSPDYPQQQVVVLSVPVVADEAVQKFLEERVAAWKAAKEELPECSDEDRWARPPKWAVMKKGKKRAVRLFDSEILAGQRCNKEGAGAFVEFRKGENIRCESYCSVAPFCEQFKKLKAGGSES